VSTFTPNKNIQEPASGSFNNAWATPVNANWSIIDEAFGGVTSIVVTGVSGTTVLTTTQYTPLILEFTGTATANLIYEIPSGVGGMWAISNTASGAFTITIRTGSSGSSVTLASAWTVVVSDGFGAYSVPFVPTAFSQITGQVTSAQIASVAGSLITGVIGVSQIPALAASQITNGVFANARLPNVFAGPGVTIQADPGTTPTGTYGQCFLYY
jgi:hypothetical protein